MSSQDGLVKAWREEEYAATKGLLARFGIEVDEARLEVVMDKDEARLRYVLAHGLDIGGIVQSLVRVSLRRHPEVGWVFVCRAAHHKGRMFRVSDHI